jgi:hypothetical protein
MGNDDDNLRLVGRLASGKKSRCSVSVCVG